MGRAGLSFRRLAGLDRAGPPPPETLPGSPLRPWTIPNAIGYLRLALIPVFLVVALRSGDGHGAAPAALYALIAWGDYLDGVAARLTRQYSRLGVILDPLVDRLMVVAGVAVCWRFDTLPRWAIAALVVREVLLLIAGQATVRRGRPIAINWWGRLAVWPTMSGVFFALAGAERLGEVLFVAGLALAWVAFALYARDAVAGRGEAAIPPSS